MATGYVKLHREAMDHPVFDDPWLWKLFCWCIMRANFIDGQVQRGSFTTGRIQAAQELKSPPSRVYEGWQRLVKLGCITLKANSRFTTITICNYETYNGDEPFNQQPGNSKATAGQQPGNTIKRREEGKKGRKAAPAAVLVPELLQTPDFASAWSDWEQHRREIGRPLKPTSAVAQLKMLAAWGHDRAVAAIRFTIFKGWQGIREPEADGKANGHAELPFGTPINPEPAPKYVPKVTKW